MMEEKLLLSIQSTSNNFSSIGYISLYKISEVIYSIRYEDDERCISVDIDCVLVDIEKKTILFQEPLQTEFSFYIPDGKELEMFQRAQKECQDICNRYLEIATRLRDVYYSGVHSTLQQPPSSSIPPPTSTATQSSSAGTASSSSSSAAAAAGAGNSNKILLNHELEDLQAQTAQEFVEILKNRDHISKLQQFASHAVNENSTTATPKGGKVAGSMTPRSTASIASSTKSETAGKANGEQKCFYCKNEFEDLADTNELYIHPYVPVGFDNSPVLMCITCLQNWKEYRDTAQYENELILPGEVNEEICCLCSDSPEVLTLCSSCPRSYCNDCLLKVLSKKEFAKRIENSDPNWKCMACINNISTVPPLSRDAWKTWTNDIRSNVTDPTSPKLKLTRGTSITSAASTPRSSHNGKKGVNNGDDEDHVSSSPGEWVTDPLFTKKNKRKFAKLEAVIENASKLQSLEEVKDSVFKQSEAFIDGSPNVADPNIEDLTGKGKGRGGRRSSAKPTVAAIIENLVDEKPVKNGRGASKGGNKKVANASSSTTTATESTKQSIECYYFQQYLDYEDQLYQDISALLGRPSKKKEIVTDDVCFLCKDGGDVVECDYVVTKQQMSNVQLRRCLKVYHQDCLGFKIPDEVEKWCCPRHFCSCCGAKDIRYICIFCPHSICSKCPETFVQQYGYARYCEVTNEIPEPALKHAKDSIPIVCECCLDMMKQVQQTNTEAAEIKLKTIEFGPEKRFPGVFQPSANSTNNPTKKRRKH